MMGKVAGTKVIENNNITGNSLDVVADGKQLCRSFLGDDTNELQLYS